MSLVTTRLAYTLCAIVVASFSLTACGDPGSSIVVARLGRNTLTKKNLERWTAIEAVLAYETDPTGPVPVGVVPDPPTYVNCIAYLKTTTGSISSQSRSTSAQLKGECEKKYDLLQHHILDILLTYYWLRGEGSERGVELTNREINEVQNGIFPTPAAFRKYLSITGERPSDERLIIEKDLLDSKLLQLKEKEMKAEGLTGKHQHERALIKAAVEFTKKWSARTSCRAGYVVSECEQYHGKRSLILP